MPLEIPCRKSQQQVLQGKFAPCWHILELIGVQMAKGLILAKQQAHVALARMSK